MSDFWTGVLVGSLAVFLMTGMIMHSIQSDYREAAIKHGCAQYNQRTGQFEWVNKP